MNVPKLVGIREMLAVPREQDIHRVKGRDRQVQGVAGTISWHHQTVYVYYSDLRDVVRHIEQVEVGDQLNSLFFQLFESPTLEFSDHRITGMQLETGSDLIPPFPRPALTCQSSYIRPPGVEEARNRCFEVSCGHEEFVCRLRGFAASRGRTCLRFSP